MNKLLTIFGSTLIVLGLIAFTADPVPLSSNMEYPAMQATSMLIIWFGAFSALGLGFVMLIKGCK